MITYNDIYEAAENLQRVSHTSSNRKRFSINSRARSKSGAREFRERRSASERNRNAASGKIK